MARQTKAEKLADQRINTAYTKNCSGVQINIMDIPIIFRAGHAAIANGADDAALAAAIVAVVENLRTN